MNRIAKERIIFDNYDVSAMYDEAKEFLMEDREEDDEPTENEIWDEVYFQQETMWEEAKAELESFFKGKTVGFFGEVGRWDGVYKAGKIGEFWKIYYSAIKDCDYVKITDENGRMYLKCTHHDGSCFFEIKEVTQQGSDYLDRWEYNYDDKRKEKEVHTQIYKRYSKNLNFAHKVYGCKKVEYEKQSKEGFKRELSKRGVSFYS